MKNKILGGLFLLGVSVFSHVNADPSCPNPIRLLDNGVTIVAEDCTVGGKIYNFQNKDYYVATDVNDIKNKIRLNFPADQIVTTKVTNLDNFGRDMSDFNQPIGNWDVSNVTNMSGVFDGLVNFNQDISAWNVEKVTNMDQMFANALKFNQDISAWNPVSLTSARLFFNNDTPFSRENYDKLLVSWSKKDLQNGVVFGSGRKYCASEARRVLINDKRWTLSDSRDSNCDTEPPKVGVPDGEFSPEDGSIYFKLYYGTDNVAVKEYEYVISECDAETRRNCVDKESEKLIHSDTTPHITIEFIDIKIDRNYTYEMRVRAIDTSNNPSDWMARTVSVIPININFEAGENGTIDNTNPQKLFRGSKYSSIELPNPVANLGYKFVNWTDLDGEEFPKNPKNVILSKTETFIANFEIDENQKIWNYKVNYYLKDSENPVPNIERNEDLGNGHINENITITPPNTPVGYKLVDNQDMTFELTGDNVIKNIYYEIDDGQRFSYIVEYFKNGELMEAITKSVLKATPNVEEKDIEDKTPKGYKLDSANTTNIPHTITADNEKIKVSYVVDTSDAGKIFDYEILYHDENTVATVKDLVSGKGYIGEEINIDQPEIPGYILKPNQKTVLVVEEKDEPTRVIVLYKKDTDNDKIADDEDEDIDGDGVSNDEELKYGSDPKDANSKPNKHSYEPEVKALSKKSNDPELTEEDLKNAIINKETFPNGTVIKLSPDVNLKEIQETEGEKEISLIVTYPDESSDVVKVKLSIQGEKAPALPSNPNNSGNTNNSGNAMVIGSAPKITELKRDFRVNAGDLKKEEESNNKADKEIKTEDKKEEIKVKEEKTEKVEENKKIDSKKEETKEKVVIPFTPFVDVEVKMEDKKEEKNIKVVPRKLPKTGAF